MSDAPESHDEEAKDEGIAAISELLKAARLRAGLELRDVAQTLRIRYRYLEAIEEGDVSSLPGKTYAMGFVRAYADHLGLDGEEMVRRFKSSVADAQQKDNLMFPSPVAESSIPSRALLFVGLVVAALGYGIWYYNSTDDEEFVGDLVAPVPERLAEQVPAPPSTQAKPADPIASASPGTGDAMAPSVTEPSAPEGPDEAAPEVTPELVPEVTEEPAETPAIEEPAVASAPDADVATPETPAETPAEPTEESTEAQAEEVVQDAAPEAVPEVVDEAAAAPEVAAAPASANAPSRVEIRARINSWIQVRDDDAGRLLFTRLLRAGDSYAVPNRSGLRLLTGNAGALEILVDGELVPSIGGEGQVRRDVVLDPERLLAGTAVLDN